MCSLEATHLVIAQLQQLHPQALKSARSLWRLVALLHANLELDLAVVHYAVPLAQAGVQIVQHVGVRGAAKRGGAQRTRWESGLVQQHSRHRLAPQFLFWFFNTNIIIDTHLTLAGKGSEWCWG